MNKHTGAPNPPGYVCPKRQNRKVFHIYLERDLATAVHDIARLTGATIQKVGEELFEIYVDRAHNWRESASGEPARAPPTPPRPPQASSPGSIEDVSGLDSVNRGKRRLEVRNRFNLVFTRSNFSR